MNHGVAPPPNVIYVCTVGSQVKEIVHETDICNLVLLTNLNLNMALHADMSSEDIEESNGQQQDNRHKGEMPGVPDELQVQSEHGGFEVGLEGNNGNVEVPWRPTCPCHLNVKGPQDTPRAGKETKTFIENVSRDLGRLSQAMERWVRLNLTLTCSWDTTRAVVYGSSFSCAS